MRNTTTTMGLLGALVGAATGAAAQEARVSAGEVAAAIAAGRTTATATVEAALAGLERWSDLNAVATPDAARARRAAAAVDAARAAGTPLGPLAGVPIVIKDNIRVEGLPAAVGTPALAGTSASAHAPVLARLVAAGAIPIATTNMHELAFGISGYNPTDQTGPGAGVRAAYDPKRMAGGSSSGTGALVGAGVVAAGLGTDTGGSVRIPCAINGCAALRPSVGRWPQDGIVPISHTRDTAGPMAASVADLELLDRIVAGGAPVAPAPLAGVRLGLAEAFTDGLDAETKAAFEAALERMKAAGATLVPVDMAGLGALNGAVSFPVALTEAHDDLIAYLKRYAPDVGIEKVVAGIRSPDVRGIYEALVVPRKLPGPNGPVDAGPIYDKAIAEGRPALVAYYAKVFGDNRLDALAFPTIPRVAVEQGPEASSMENFGTFIRNTDPGSHAGLPGLTLPIGGGAASGLPIGMELDGPAGSDRRLLVIGLALEGLFGRLPPPKR